MFLKYGYYRYTGKSSSETIKYVEKKTKHLQITNIDGASLFEIPIPESHSSMPFHDVAVATEESLRSVLITDELLECRHVRSNAAPCHTANPSSEYMLIRSKVVANTTLQSLARVLEKFCEHPLSPKRSLAPKSYSSTMAPWSPTTRRKQLASWEEEHLTANAESDVLNGGHIEHLRNHIGQQRRHHLTTYADKVKSLQQKMHDARTPLEHVTQSVGNIQATESERQEMFLRCEFELQGQLDKYTVEINKITKDYRKKWRVGDEVVLSSVRCGLDGEIGIVHTVEANAILVKMKCEMKTLPLTSAKIEASAYGTCSLLMELDIDGNT